MNEPYQNREIDAFMSNIKDQLDRIEAQTIKTNGRVTRNELDVSNLNMRINTTIWAFGITLPIILSLVGWIFYNELQKLTISIESIQQDIPYYVRQALDTYQFEIIDPLNNK